MFTQYNYFKDLIDDHGENFRIATDIVMRQDFKKWLMKYAKRNYEFISSRANKESVPKNDGIELEKIKKDLDFMFLYFEMFNSDLILNDFEVQKILNYTPAPINFHIFSDEKEGYYWMHNESQIPKEDLIDILSYLGFPEENAYVIAMFLIVNTEIKKFVTQTFLNIKFPIN